MIEVRVPKQVAEQALAAWARDDTGPDVDETRDQRVYRHRGSCGCASTDQRTGVGSLIVRREREDIFLAQTITSTSWS